MRDYKKTQMLLKKTGYRHRIIKHPSVVASPIAKDTILVRDKLTGKNN